MRPNLASHGMAKGTTRVLSCREVVKSASDYLDGNVSWRRRLQMRLHLAMCVHCRRYVGQLALSIATLRGLKQDPVAPDTVDQVMAALRQARSDGSAGARPGSA
jgi:anti-sigma factor RsiW